MKGERSEEQRRGEDRVRPRLGARCANSTAVATRTSWRRVDLAALQHGPAAGLEAELRGVDVECSLSCDRGAQAAAKSKVCYKHLLPEALRPFTFRNDHGIA